MIKLVTQMAFSPFAMAALLFFPARTLHFWQAWVFLILNFVATAFSCVYFYQRDPQLLQRRMLRKETQPGQSTIMSVWKLVMVGSLVLAGLDHRLAWSERDFMPVPLWLEVLAFAVLSGATSFFSKF